MASCKGVIILIFIVNPSFAQHGTGLSLDLEDYQQGEVRATQTRGASLLPIRCSLKMYAPPAGDQGATSQCVAWACAYAARTITESKASQRSDAAFITRHTYSPSFLYRLAAPADTNCSTSVSISQVLETMKLKGDLIWTENSQSCVPAVRPEQAQTAAASTIRDYYRLYKKEASASIRIMLIKKSLLGGRPVITGLLCPPSLFNVKEVWRPTEEVTGIKTGQAVCIVGYDDASFGGAFEIMNSWGTNWGRKGFAWVTYSDFLKYGQSAFALVNISPSYSGAVVDDFSPDLTGDFVIKTNRNDSIGVHLLSREGGIISYKAVSALKGNGLFRICINTFSPEYVYILECDESLQLNILFPFDASINAALDDSLNQIEYPAEAGFFHVRAGTGSRYLFLICSKDELRIQKLVDDANSQTDMNITHRLTNIFRGKLLPGRDLWVEKDRISSKGVSSGQHTLFINVIEYQTSE